MEFLKEEPEVSTHPEPCRVKDEEIEKETGWYSKQWLLGY